MAASTGVGLCVGSALNFLTGRVKRAPPWIREANLEWAWRLAQRPAGISGGSSSSPRRSCGSPCASGCGRSGRPAMTQCGARRVLDRSGPTRVRGSRARRERSWLGAGSCVLLTCRMFGGLFHYVVDAPPLYLLAKAWPVLTAPLALFAAWRLRSAVSAAATGGLRLAAGGDALHQRDPAGQRRLGAAGLDRQDLAADRRARRDRGAAGAIRPSPSDLTRAVVVLARGDLRLPGRGLAVGAGRPVSSGRSRTPRSSSPTPNEAGASTRR